MRMVLSKILYLRDKKLAYFCIKRRPSIKATASLLSSALSLAREERREARERRDVPSALELRIRRISLALLSRCGASHAPKAQEFSRAESLLSLCSHLMRQISRAREEFSRARKQAPNLFSRTFGAREPSSLVFSSACGCL